MKRGWDTIKLQQPTMTKVEKFVLVNVSIHERKFKRFEVLPCSAERTCLTHIHREINSFLLQAKSPGVSQSKIIEFLRLRKRFQAKRRLFNVAFHKCTKIPLENNIFVRSWLLA